MPPGDGYPMGFLRSYPHYLLLIRRFLVVTEILQPEDPVGSSVLHGLEYIDVPGSGKKDYKLTFLSYKEGVFSTMVSVDTRLQGSSRSCLLAEKPHASFHTSTCPVYSSQADTRHLHMHSLCCQSRQPLGGCKTQAGQDISEVEAFWRIQMEILCPSLALPPMWLLMAICGVWMLSWRALWAGLAHPVDFHV